MQTSVDKMTQSWQASVYAVLRHNHVRQIAYVPDAGFSELLNLCLDDPAMSSTVLTTEEEGVGLLARAWLGGDRGVNFQASYKNLGQFSNKLPSATSMTRGCATGSADVGRNFQLPDQTGRRFSMNASMPSVASSVIMLRTITAPVNS